jgi:hypothetical protein
MESEATQPMKKKGKVNGSRTNGDKVLLAPVEVLIVLMS